MAREGKIHIGNYGTIQRIGSALVIWHLCKQPVDRFGKDLLNQNA